MFCSFKWYNSLSKVEIETFIYQILLKTFGLWPFWRCKKRDKRSKLLSSLYPGVISNRKKNVWRKFLLYFDSTETGAPNCKETLNANKNGQTLKSPHKQLVFPPELFYCMKNNTFLNVREVTHSLEWCLYFTPTANIPHSIFLIYYNFFCIIIFQTDEIFNLDFPLVMICKSDFYFCRNPQYNVLKVYYT